MSQPIRSGALIAAGLLAALGLTGCNAAPHAAASHPAATHSAAPALPTGHMLATRLLPASAMPAGLKLTPGDSRNTGDHNLTATASPYPAAKACDRLNKTGWVVVAGHSSASWAQNDYTDASGNMVAQEADAYPGTGSSTVFAALRSVFAHCGTFTTKQGGTSYTEHLAVKPLPGIGDAAAEAVITSPSFDGGTTVVAVRTGHIVVTVMDNSISGTDTGTKAAGFARSLTQRMTAAH